MTWLLIIAFVLLIAVVGAGLDVFLTIDTPVRFIMLPFVLLMAVSGIWNFRSEPQQGCGKNKKHLLKMTTTSHIALAVKILLGSMVLVAILPVILEPQLLDIFFQKM